MKEVEEASPDHYPRLLLYRLLETQKCLSSIIKHPALATVKTQFMVNESTLSEIKSWLEAQGGNFHPSLSSSSVTRAERLGVVFTTQGEVLPTVAGEPQSPFAILARPRVLPPGESGAPSSQHSEPIKPPSVKSTRTPFYFPLKSSSEKQSSPSNGGTPSAGSE